jgi:hypothetical protein
MTPETQQARKVVPGEGDPPYPAAVFRGDVPPYPVGAVPDGSNGHRIGRDSDPFPRGDAPPVSWPAGQREYTGQAAGAGNWGTAERPSPPPLPSQAPAPPLPQAAETRAQGDASIVRVIPLLAVIVVAVAGVYIAWRQGSAGGGEGGVVGGVALLAAAVARLLLPARLVGLLATRKRATDVITLTVLGASLLIAGLVLPR